MENDNDLRTTLKRMLEMTETELLAIANDLKKPYIERKIALAINKGDWRTIQSMLNQVYDKHAGGRPTNEIKDIDKEWNGRSQINSAKLEMFMYRDNSQSNNPITVETLQDLKMAFCIGSNQREACEYAGITPVSYCEWKRKMPDDLRAKWDFLVAKWQNQMILKARNTINENLGDPMTSKWYLERKRREEFATRTEQELKRVEKFSDLSDEDLNDMIGVVNGESR